VNHHTQPQIDFSVINKCSARNLNDSKHNVGSSLWRAIHGFLKLKLEFQLYGIWRVTSLLQAQVSHLQNGHTWSHSLWVKNIMDMKDLYNLKLAGAH
jgi:hypothetical protein